MLIFHLLFTQTMTPYNNLRRLLSVGLLLITFITTYAQELPIIPQPVSVQWQSGLFTFTTTTAIRVSNASLTPIANLLQEKVKSRLSFVPAINSTGNIRLELLAKHEAVLGTEGYRLDISASNITIKANASAGVFYGVQSLLQLLPASGGGMSAQVRAVSIVDYPRFAWRGLMLDVSRHFFGKDYVKQYIDRMALYKFNRFHFHLTDDNGWRLEIKSLPRLTQVGAWRVPRTGTFGSNEAPQPGEAPTYGGFYTQDDIREIVQYAKARYIEVIPEIDVPGHSMAALAAYPSLCVTGDTTLRVNPGSKFSTWFGNGKFEMHLDNTLNPTDEKVYDFLNKVFTEIAVLFPYEYIHIGGDECYKGYWERDARVQAFMKKNNLKDGEALQNYFTNRVSKIVLSKKKKPIGWDEILEGGHAVPEAAVMSWRGTKGGVEAAHQKHQVVMSPAPVYYLDMMQGDASVEAPVYSSARLKEVYAFDILPAGIDSTYVLGGQGNLWTEQTPTVAQVEYMTYPRALAMAESLWTPRTKKNWTSFAGRMELQLPMLEAAGVNYSTSYRDPIISVKKNAAGLYMIELSSEVDGLDFYYTLDNAIPNAYHPRYTGTITVPKDVDRFRVIAYRQGKPVGNLITLKTDELEKRVKK